MDVDLVTNKFGKYLSQNRHFVDFVPFFKKKQDAIKQGLFKKHTSLNSIIRWDVILGLQFENLVLDNLQTIFLLLRIDPATIINAAPFFQRKTLRHEACQIDLFIQTKHTLYVCEIKCRAKIDTKTLDETKNKITRLKLSRALSVRTVLIYEGEVEQALLKDGYFDFIISFEDMLNTRLES